MLRGEKLWTRLVAVMPHCLKGSSCATQEDFVVATRVWSPSAASGFPAALLRF